MSIFFTLLLQLHDVSTSLERVLFVYIEMLCGSVTQYQFINFKCLLVLSRTYAVVFMADVQVIYYGV